MSTPTAFEQEMLELINRARANPQGEFDALISDAAVGTAITSNITQALAFFNVDLDLFKQQLAGLPAAAPLAWNNNLAQAAETHTNLMIEEDEQSHRLPGEASLGDRVRDAGYNFNRLAENIFAYTTDPVYGHAGFYIDWGFGPGGIQDPAGHRNAILSASYKEIGIAAVAEANPNTQVGPYVVTQNFGSRSGYEAQLVGVAIEDFDGDVFYDAGEGLSGVTVTATGNGGTFTTTTWGSGGFQMVLPSGTYTVTFTGGGMNTTVTSTVTIGSQNVKLDAITPTNDSDRFDGKAGNDILDLLGGNDIFAAGEGNDSVAGGGGRDTLLGGNREDSLSGGADNDLLRGGAGFDRLMGDGGNDTLYGGGQADNAFGGAGTDLMFGDQGFDRLFGGSGNDTGYGGEGTDGLFGEAGDDRLFGQGQDDRFFGGQGNDYLDGGADNDNLIGGAGFDTLLGSTGNDTLSGKFNADIFLFTDFGGGFGRDTITDFAANNDFEKISLQGVAAITDFNDLSANHMRQAGANVVIDDLAGNTITLLATQINDLDTKDFIF